MGAPHDQLFWRLNERQEAAALEGNEKLVRDGTKPDQLFDLSTDIGEARNLANTDETTVGEMNNALDARFGQMTNKFAFPGMKDLNANGRASAGRTNKNVGIRRAACLTTGPTNP